MRKLPKTSAVQPKTFDYNEFVEREIQLLQFLICKDFREDARDLYTAEQIRSNLRVPKFPYRPRGLCIVTCWKKDRKFHKEIIEYETDYGAAVRTPHMDIEPITNGVLFRWHKHPFPARFVIERPTVLTLRVILDRKPVFESYLLLEEKTDFSGPVKR
jgi:hypothetical protein